MLTAEELKALAERAERLTPGPWTWHGYRDGYEIVSKSIPNAPPLVCRDGGVRWVRDADFISHAREDIPALLAHIAELEGDATNWRKVETMPMDFRLAHFSVVLWPDEPDYEQKRHYEWAVLYDSVFTSNGATPEEALDRAMTGSYRCAPDFVVALWRETFEAGVSKLENEAALEAARKGET
jgi:hypothetical protein